jgi:alpha-tubulin suppressor-like RCC1 family protein
VSLDDFAYCWGDASTGQVGTGSYVNGSLLRPTAVSGGLRFKEVKAGYHTTCGVTTDNRAYCWGENAPAIGSVPPEPNSLFQQTPRLVAGGLHFRTVSPKFLQTCGVTTYDVAYCWGQAFGPSLGDGKTKTSFMPVRVAGDLQVRDVSAGFYAACEVTMGNRGYCWGYNFAGQVGDGTTTDRSTPVPVAGVM